MTEFSFMALCGLEYKFSFFAEIDISKVGSIYKLTRICGGPRSDLTVNCTERFRLRASSCTNDTGDFTSEFSRSAFASFAESTKQVISDSYLKNVIGQTNVWLMVNLII